MKTQKNFTDESKREIFTTNEFFYQLMEVITNVTKTSEKTKPVVPESIKNDQGDSQPTLPNEMQGDRKNNDLPCRERRE